MNFVCRYVIFIVYYMNPHLSANLIDIFICFLTIQNAIKYDSKMLQLKEANLSKTKILLRSPNFCIVFTKFG